MTPTPSTPLSASLSPATAGLPSTPGPNPAQAIDPNAFISALQSLGAQDSPALLPLGTTAPHGSGLPSPSTSGPNAQLPLEVTDKQGGNILPPMGSGLPHELQAHREATARMPDLAFASRTPAAHVRTRLDGTGTSDSLACKDAEDVPEAEAAVSSLPSGGEPVWLALLSFALPVTSQSTAPSPDSASGQLPPPLEGTSSAVQGSVVPLPDRSPPVSRASKGTLEPTRAADQSDAPPTNTALAFLSTRIPTTQPDGKIPHRPSAPTTSDRGNGAPGYSPQAVARAATSPAPVFSKPVEIVPQNSLAMSSPSAPATRLSVLASTPRTEPSPISPAQDDIGPPARAQSPVLVRQAHLSRLPATASAQAEIDLSQFHFQASRVVEGGVIEKPSPVGNPKEITEPSGSGDTREPSSPASVPSASPPSSIRPLAPVSVSLPSGGDPEAVRGGITSETTSISQAAPDDAPQDFATLVSRLHEAREAGAGQTVRTALVHAQFGHIALQFRPDDAGMSVSMTSADPDFAASVQSAAASVLAASHAQGSDTPRDGSSGQPQSSSNAPANQQGGTSGNGQEHKGTHGFAQGLSQGPGSERNLGQAPSGNGSDRAPRDSSSARASDDTSSQPPHATRDSRGGIYA